jgi:plastocyanin
MAHPTQPPAKADEKAGIFQRWKWLKPALITVGVLAFLYGGYAIFVSYSNGTSVHVTLHAGTIMTGPNQGKMYIRCDVAASTPGSCDDKDQVTVTVHQRDRVRFTVISDDGPSPDGSFAGRAHDFRLEGWQYFLPPAGVEMELTGGQESSSMTAWAKGTFLFKCELSGHEAEGMYGHLVVE